MNHKALRELLATVQTRIDSVSEVSTTADAKERVAALGTAWSALGTHLAVGPAPDTRDCPACKREIMRAASVCGYCWEKLSGTHVTA